MKKAHFIDGWRMWKQNRFSFLSILFVVLWGSAVFAAIQNVRGMNVGMSLLAQAALPLPPTCWP